MVATLRPNRPISTVKSFWKGVNLLRALQSGSWLLSLGLLDGKLDDGSNREEKEDTRVITRHHSTAALFIQISYYTKLG